MRSAWRHVRRLAAVACGGMLAGCALLEPLPKSAGVEERLKAFPTQGLPLQGRVQIRWDSHQIPFIEAESDDDAAFALGLVHAHLRLGQMAIYRRIAQGRIAEMGGPLAVDIDHAIRVLDFGRGAATSEAALPDPTRRWLQRFVDGINLYQERADPLPVEYAILGLAREPWTVRDVLTFGRLAGSDVNWIVWFNLLKLRDRTDWGQIWTRLITDGGDRPLQAADAFESGSRIEDVLAGLGRTGSNSLAIAPARSRTGAAILANDPHLGIGLPNTWIIAGLNSPSFQVVGLMIPGLPVFAIGRNPHIAWGGTNMRASASDLVDVSGVPAAARSETVAKIGVRWWFDDEVTLRSTRFGPILSDAPQLRELTLPDLALRWTGHLPSDEVTAMLNVARARTFDAFRSAFASFAVPGQNMLYADAEGNIGQVFAARVPDRGGPPPADVVVTPEAAERSWQQLQTAATLPVVLNPEQGFIASANNRPRTGEAAVGWFFSPDDRVRRMAALIEETGSVNLDQVKAMQRDVFVESSAALNRLLVTKLQDTGVAAQAEGQQRRVFALMAGWDGHYRADAQGPVAFELFRFHFTRDFYAAAFGATDWAAFAGVGRIKVLMIEDIASQPNETLAPTLRRSLDQAGRRLPEFASWGDMHRLVLRHPLAFLPLVGSRFSFDDIPIGGSSDSLMKTAHASTEERHRASYGANARHLSDLSDVDRNWFVILGGQDGWLNSTTFRDQVPLWLQGLYVNVPLRPETVRARFSHVTELRR